MKQKPAEKNQRRAFLKGAGLAAAAVGSGAVSTTSLAKTQEIPQKETPSGYQETEHVREYYRLARF